MDDGVEPAAAQIAGEQRRGSGAIDVVIAEDRDALAVDRGMHKSRARRRHIGEYMRIGHQRADAGIEIAGDRVGLDAAPREYPRQQFRHAGALHDGKRARLPALVEAIAPGAPGRGFLHAEKEAFG